MKHELNIMSIWKGETKALSFFQRLFRRPKATPKPLTTPKMISEDCNGIMLGGKNVKSLLFSTDMAIIENNDADAILAVYPFAPSPKIMKALIDFSDRPVICGVGGGLTQGKVAMEMAIQAEALGAAAIIVNQPFKNKDLNVIRKKITIPIISSVSVTDFSFQDRVDAGVDVFHITGGKNTAKILEQISYAVPGYPIMATGGKSLESIQSAITSGADAIVLTPPTSGELFKSIMDGYRKGLDYLRQ